MFDEERSGDGLGEDVSDILLTFNPLEFDGVVVEVILEEMILDVDVFGAIAVDVMFSDLDG